MSDARTGSRLLGKEPLHRQFVAALGLPLRNLPKARLGGDTSVCSCSGYFRAMYTLHVYGACYLKRGGEG